MNLTYACPRCEAGQRAEIGPRQAAVSCTACQAALTFPPDARDGERLRRCLVCPSTELFVRKDFPQRLGVAIVVVGLGLSCVFWAQYEQFWTYAVLFGTVLVDVLLYALVGNSLMCYRCQAQYRGIANLNDFGAFRLETHERYRQQQARLDGRA